MNRAVLFLILISNVISLSQTPFTKGVNLTGWFQASGPTQIQFNKYTKQDFLNIKSLGCDVVRLPINLHAMTNGAPAYQLDETFLFFLDSAIDMAEETGIHLIIDNHTFDVDVSTSTDIDQVLIPVWTNMAEHLKNRSELVYYEVLNEPHGIDDARWNEIQQSVIEAIRKVDTVHTIVIGPAGWNSYNNLKYMPEYDDDNLIYTFHFYDPFLFTHQGASWTDPSMESLGGVPFPYNASKMPQVPDDLKGTWVEGSLNNDYRNVGTIAYVKEQIDKAVQFAEERNAKIFCGEFGVYIPNSNNNDRILWYSIVRSYFEQNNIAWTIWDYHGGFGLFEENSAGLFEHDLNVHLVNALGLNAPEQTELIIRPDSTGFDLYTDFYGPDIYGTSSGSGTTNLYSGDDTYSGKYSILWSDVNQYSGIQFDFRPDKDLSELVNNGYELRFKVKGDSPGASFDIRFLDTKTDLPEDHPWRMRYTIDESLVQWDHEWHSIKLPLINFTEHGSWDNETWYEPVGAFDWSKTDRFEIVAEHHSLAGMTFRFDDIKIVDRFTGVEQSENFPQEFELKQNYPNPFNPITIIEYSIPVVDEKFSSTTDVKLIVYDILGREVATLVDATQQPGSYKVSFDGKNLNSGVYFYRLQAGDFSDVRRMVLVK